MPEATVSPPRVAGAYILTSTWIEIEESAGLTLADASRRYITPASALLTMLYAKQCPPVAMAIKDVESGRWCPVYSPGLVDDPTDVRSSRLEEPPLLDRDALGLERLAAWFPLVERLTPLPQLIAGAADTGPRTVQNLLLELATAAEGVHRKVHPDSRRLSDEAKADALRAIAEMDTGQDAKTILCQAMGTYLAEFSYPMRLKALAADVVDAVPGVTGNTKRWSQAVVTARNGFAHWLTGAAGENEIISHHILHNSLRWLLVGRLLIEAGVPVDLLARKFTDFEPYRRFLEGAHRTLPRIYGSSPTTSAQ